MAPAAPFVTLAGTRPQSETPRTLAASDILLSPHVPNPDGTPFFGSPTKLFEYMAMQQADRGLRPRPDRLGAQGLAARRGPPPAYEEGRVRGAIFAEPGSVDSLLAGIRRAVELSSAEREALGTTARRLVTESFTWDRNVAAVLARLRAGNEPAVLGGRGGA